MCFYIAFASCEGLKWFNVKRNPLLVVGAVGAVLAFVGGGEVPPCSAMFVTAWGWSCYAMLVTLQYCRVRLFQRHVIPVNIPLVLLLTCCFRNC